jgi:hypothetical protein
MSLQCSALYFVAIIASVVFKENNAREDNASTLKPKKNNIFFKFW